MWTLEEFQRTRARLTRLSITRSIVHSSHVPSLQPVSQTPHLEFSIDAAARGGGLAREGPVVPPRFARGGRHRAARVHRPAPTLGRVLRRRPAQRTGIDWLFRESTTELRDGSSDSGTQSRVPTYSSTGRAALKHTLDRTLEPRTLSLTQSQTPNVESCKYCGTRGGGGCHSQGAARSARKQRRNAKKSTAVSYDRDHPCCVPSSSSANRTRPIGSTT